jgi:glycosyltransferase involved in cell wall biosynthesis
MKKMNVLMLGWHSSPLLSGGLGVASYGIAKALSDHVNLSLILPEIDPEMILDNVDLTGLEEINVEEIKIRLAEPQYEAFAPVQYIQTDILPYQTYEAEDEPEKEVTKEEIFTRAAHTAPAPNIPEVAAPPAESPKRKEEYPNSKEESRVPKTSIFQKAEAYGDDLNFQVIQYARYAARLASAKDFDLIYAHDWMTFQAGIEIKMVTGKPLVLHVHTLEYDRKGPKSKGWIYELERKALVRADAIISVSQYTASILEEHYGVDPEKVIPVYHGLEPVSPFRTEKAPDDKLVVFLGRFSEQKGPSYFLQIALKVQEQYPEAHFVMAGTGPLLEKTKTSAEARALGDRISFPGFLERMEVYDLLSRADVFCMPSVSDPFGLSALEAAQFGVPVVLSKQAGVAEVLRNALKADYQDTDLMARHVLHLLTEDSFRKKVIAETFYDIENLTWENTAEEIVDVFEMVQMAEPGK